VSVSVSVSVFVSVFVSVSVSVSVSASASASASASLPVSVCMSAHKYPVFESTCFCCGLNTWHSTQTLCAEHMYVMM